MQRLAGQHGMRSSVLCSKAVRPSAELAREMGMLKLGTVALDGSRIHAKASRHSRALS